MQDTTSLVVRRIQLAVTIVVAVTVELACALLHRTTAPTVASMGFEAWIGGRWPRRRAKSMKAGESLATRSPPGGLNLYPPARTYPRVPLEAQVLAVFAHHYPTPKHRLKPTRQSDPLSGNCRSSPSSGATHSKATQRLQHRGKISLL